MPKRRAVIRTSSIAETKSSCSTNRAATMDLKGKCVRICKTLGEIVCGLLIAATVVYYLQLESPSERAPDLSEGEEPIVIEPLENRKFLENVVVGLPKNVALDQHIEKYDNGEIKLQGKVVNGRRSGSWAAFNRDGTPSWTAYYRRGKLHGAYRQWVRRNGELIGVWNGVFKHGEKEGTWYWYEEGILRKLRYWKSGVFDEAILDDKGEIISMRENCQE